MQLRRQEADSTDSMDLGTAEPAGDRIPSKAVTGMRISIDKIWDAVMASWIVRVAVLSTLSHAQELHHRLAVESGA